MRWPLPQVDIGGSSRRSTAAEGASVQAAARGALRSSRAFGVGRRRTKPLGSRRDVYLEADHIGIDTVILGVTFW